MAELGLEATYMPTGDFIGTKVYLQEDDEFRPDLIRSGVMELRNADGKILQSADFDYRYGTAEGFVRSLFLHPLQTQGLSVHALITRIDNGEELSISAPVQQDVLRPEDFDILAEQKTEVGSARIYPFEPGAVDDVLELLEDE